MAYGNEILERLKSVNIKTEAQSIAKTHEQDFAELNRKQLIQGKDRTGNYLPKYTDYVGDYFKTIDSARAYARFKQIIHPNNEKPFDVADFYINGKYHRNIVAEVRGMNLNMSNRTPYAENIAAKAQTLGINPENAQFTREEFLMPELRERVRSKTGAK
jgi:thymidine phosphorylase